MRVSTTSDVPLSAGATPIRCLSAPAPPRESRTAFAPLPGIVATLKDPSNVGQRSSAINRPVSAKVAQALDSAGLQPVEPRPQGR
jgi:hypothetical protein